MKSQLKLAMVSALALSTAAPAAVAQYYQPTPQYQRDYQNYQGARANYEVSRADYAAARAEYEARRADWERARADYDARYGYGAYSRRYGAAPVWDTGRWGAYDANTFSSNASYSSGDYEMARRDYERRLDEYERARTRYDRRNGYGAYARRYGPAPTWDEARYGGPRSNTYGSNAYGSNSYNSGAYSAGTYGANTAYNTQGTTVRCNNNSTVTAGVIGAIAGALLGSNVAARNARTEGAVLGAVVGGVGGAAVGRANDRYKCDTQGPYFSREDTVPYREAARSERFDYYTGRRCRLAPAPVDTAGQDYRYVRVCPDDQGRYRITG